MVNELSTHESMSTITKKTVLVIDDDEGVADIVSELLQAANYSPLIATEAQRGLELASTLEPSVIICDVVMPQLSGFTAVAALKDNPATAHIPVILMSSYHSFYSGLPEDAAAFLPKPFHPDELVATLQIVLSNLASRLALNQTLESKSDDTEIGFAC